jgi:hypothetical protein
MIQQSTFIEIVKYANVVTLWMSFSRIVLQTKRVQNQVLKICGEMITLVLVSVVKDAKFFSVLADRPIDCPIVKQMW